MTYIKGKHLGKGAIEGGGEVLPQNICNIWSFVRGLRHLMTSVLEVKREDRVVVCGFVDRWFQQSFVSDDNKLK